MSATTISADDSASQGEIQVHALYQELLNGWNKRNAADFAAQFQEDGNCVGFDGSQLDANFQRLLKTSSSSLKEASAANASNEPVSLRLREARMKAPHATRASAEPTETRRTPRSASRESESAASGLETRTLTGFGETAFTIAAISSGLETPGA
jgi:uncharacterized protein (TIGR02246 family)